MPDSSSPIPLYEQVRRQIQVLIESTYQPGDTLPSQQTLAQDTGASLITVKRALTELAREGIVESARGRGTTVRRKPVADLHSGVSSWTCSVTDSGATPSTAWTRIAVIPPEAATSNLLGLRAQATVTRVERLRMIDGHPVCLMTNEVPTRFVPGLDAKGLQSESFYETLRENYDLDPARAFEEVTARPPTEEERTHLGEDCQAVLVVHRRTFLADDTPLEIGTIIAHGDHYRYQVNLIN